MKFVMQRDRVVPTLFGQAFGFKKGVPLEVPQIAWEVVQAAGAMPVDELPTEEEGAPVVPQGEARVAALTEAVEKIVKRGARDDFTASGSPHAAALSKEVGFPVDAKERDAIWLRVQQAADAA